MVGTFAKVDKEGRGLIPAKIREELNTKNIVEIEVQGKNIILKPVEDPSDSLEKLLLKTPRILKKKSEPCEE